MSNEQVIERVKRKDWALVDDKVKIDPLLAPQLQALVQTHPEYEVRELALYCLADIGGPAARRGILAALQDANATVRSTAFRLLQDHYDREDLPALLKELAANRDEYVRAHVALALGKIGEPSVIPTLKQRQEVEKEESALHNIYLAMARLKEPASHNKYIASLNDPDPKQRAAALADFKYVNDRSLLPRLLPLLDDQRNAANASPGRDKYYIRVCDVAVNMLDDYLNHPFSFEIGFRTHYTTEQINEVKKAIGQAR